MFSCGTRPRRNAGFRFPGSHATTGRRSRRRRRREKVFISVFIGGAPGSPRRLPQCLDQITKRITSCPLEQPNRARYLTVIVSQSPRHHFTETTRTPRTIGNRGHKTGIYLALFSIPRRSGRASHDKPNHGRGNRKLTMCSSSHSGERVVHHRSRTRSDTPPPIGPTPGVTGRRAPDRPVVMRVCLRVRAACPGTPVGRPPSPESAARRWPWSEGRRTLTPYVIRRLSESETGPGFRPFAQKSPTAQGSPGGSSVPAFPELLSYRPTIPA